MTFAKILSVLVVAMFSITGCSRDAEVTEVTVTAGPVTVTLPAALSCYSPTTEAEPSCVGTDNDDDAPHLALAPGTPLDISVPKTVSDTPWVVLLSYVDADGEEHSDRTAVFPPKERQSYHLLPPSGAQLTRLEVQSLTVAAAGDGSLTFPAAGAWVLVIDPVGAANSTATATPLPSPTEPSPTEPSPTESRE